MNGPVVLLGNFDGVHRGHQELVAQARRAGSPLTVVTFAPHPRRFFAADLPPFLLTSPAQKEERLRAAGVDHLVALTFDATLASMPAEIFAREILVNRLGACCVVAGDDYRFGHARQGDMARMAAWLRGKAEVISVPPVRDAEGQRYAASTIRVLLQTGQVEAAAVMLGRPWILRGRIVPGNRRGHMLGFPTANIDFGDYVRPLFGVYAIRGRRCTDNLMLDGVANLGCRPTVDGTTPWLEAHFFDFGGSLYDQEWDIALHHFLRPERRFDSLDALKSQISEDCQAARAALRASSTCRRDELMPLFE